jgi:hypothetical protein
VSRRLLIVAAVLAGLAVGVGSDNFVYAKGHSYLTNDPAACAPWPGCAGGRADYRRREDDPHAAGQTVTPPPSR